MNISGTYTDLYELTMAQGYFLNNMHEKIVTFELFFRKNPFEGGYAVATGIYDAVQFIKNFSFSDSDITYLRSLNMFQEQFLIYLKSIKFEGEIDGVLEGTLVFPQVPILQVTSSLIVGQLLESALLNIVNFQTLIATKAARICSATLRKDSVLDFGLRRAHGTASITGAKAAIIGGCIGTSNVLAGKKYNLLISGTHAHSWVQSFESELEAFRAYAAVYPDNCTLLVDTYNVLKSGVPNAISVAKELEQQGHKLEAIRIDSGDLAWLSLHAAKMLDAADLAYVKIVLSSDLDEYLIESIVNQLRNSEYHDTNALISRMLWGVGTKMITGSTKGVSALGGVYKLVEIDHHPVIKLSENPAKITNPGRKKLWRIIDRKSKTWIADLIGLASENSPEDGELIYHPTEPNKFQPLCACEKIPLHVDLWKKYANKKAENVWKESRAKAQKELNMIDPSHLRFLNPHIYKVSLTSKLQELKQHLIQQHQM